MVVGNRFNGFTGDKLEIRVPCKPEYVRTIRHAIAEFAVLLNMPDSAVADIEIAASEAVANVIRHAYRGCQKLPPLRVKCAQSRSGLTIEVVDKGCGFDAPPKDVIPDVDLEREGGLGIILIKNFMDRVYYVSRPGEGTRIRMTKRLSSKIADSGNRSSNRINGKYVTSPHQNN